MTQPPSSSHRPPPSPQLAESLARLRAEQAAAKPEAKPLFSHELGVAQEAVDEASATRDFLAAFNGDPRFREPLEALLRLFGRRPSTKNLGKLLDALTRASETAEEKARAFCERGGFLVGEDEEGARASFEAALAAIPDDPTAWLEIEMLAAQGGDIETRARALEARSSLTKDPSWRGLLLIDRAELEAQRGDRDKAVELLESATELSGIARFPAWRALEALARREGLETRLVQALEAQGELSAEALADGTAGDALGVPHHLRKPSSVAELWLRASEAQRRLGDSNGAASALDRALEILPGDSRLLWARLALAEASTDREKALELTRALLEAGTTPSSAASLWLRVAEARTEGTDGVPALDALRNALDADPACIPASALRLDLLEEGGDAEALALALEHSSESFESEEAKAYAHLLAAYVHARDNRDVPSAKAALAQAASLGAPPSVLARAARLFARLLGDDAWLDEASFRLALTTEIEAEPASLWFELARGRLLQRDHTGADQALASLLASSGGRWLGSLLLAYAQTSSREDSAALETASLEALDELAARQNDPEMARALLIVAATRANALGDLEGAKARLRELQEANPEDEIAAVYLADLERCSGAPQEAARVLARTAAGARDAELAAALHFEAFALAFRAGDREAALRELEAAAELSKEALAWALRATSPDDQADRRRALDLAEGTGDDLAASALERFGLTSFEEGYEARSWLDVIESRGAGPLLLAWSLAHLISPSDDREALERALDRLGSHSTVGRALAAFERLRVARLEGHAEAAELAAREWAEAEEGLAPALEWLSTTLRLENRDAEVLARKRVAAGLRGEERAAMEASAAAVLWASDAPSPLPLLDSTHLSSRLLNLELGPLGCDPRRRAHVLSNLDTALGSEAQVDALLLAGENHLAAGDAAAALLVFQKVTEARPDEPWGWEGVRAAAEALEDPRSFAIACAHLGELLQDDARGAELWEQAGLVLLDRLKEPRQAELALEAAFARDPKRAVAFDRLFRHVREAGNHEKLLSLIARRLEVADDSAELAKLFWEQARALRQQGHREGALAALESVTAIEPDHIGALALSGEIFITQGQYAEAAQALARLATLPEAPDKQRLMSAVAAVDLYENKLGDSIRALEVLVGLHEAGLSNLPVRERLARAAAKTESWRHAASIFEELMNDRPTREGRIEAARLAMALWRDKLDLPARAERATAKLLSEAPGDDEAIDIVLASPFDPSVKRSLLESSRDVLVRAIAAEPSDADGIARLAAVARALSDLPLRQASLGALVAVGRAEPSADAELSDLDQRVRSTPQVAVDEATIAKIADPEDTGPIARLFHALSEPLGEALGPSLAAMGVGKKDRIDPRAGFPVRNEIAAWAGALGIDEIAVYIGGPDPEGVQAIAGEAPAIVIGTAIRAPLAPRQRQAIARELFALRRGTIVTRTRDETTIAALVVAACNLADVTIDAPPYALLSDLQRQLGKTLSRKTKKLLPVLCRDVVSSGQDPKRWARAAQLSMHRMAAIAAGDVSFVLADLLDQPRRQLASAVARDERASRLIAFVLSPHYLELRERLGMGIQ